MLKTFDITITTQINGDKDTKKLKMYIFIKSESKEILSTKAVFGWLFIVLQFVKGKILKSTETIEKNYKVEFILNELLLTH